MAEAEWAFVLPCLPLMTEEASQRVYDLRDIFDALRWLVHTGTPWRYLPVDFPPWEAVFQQIARWIQAGSFEAIVHDLRALLRLKDGQFYDPSAVILDGRKLQSTPESGHRAGYDGHKPYGLQGKKKGSKVHIAVNILGHPGKGVRLLTLVLTPANEQERAQAGTPVGVEELAE